MAGWLVGMWYPSTKGPCPVIGIPKDGMSRACIMLLMLMPVPVLLLLLASGIAMHTDEPAMYVLWLRL